MLKIQFNAPREDELNFAAANFCLIPEDQLDELDPSIVGEIISRPCLTLSSEDWLYTFLAARFARDPLYFQMLEFVRFEFLSFDVILQFIRDTKDYFGCLNVCIWDRIARRLALAVPDSYFRRIEVPLDPEAPLDGIIALLSDECLGNVDDRGVVEISASGTWSKFLPKYIADLHSEDHFCSTNFPNEWVCYDFLRNRVTPTHYSLRSYCDGSEDRANPRSWAIEASNDCYNWIELDRQNKNDDLDGSGLIGTYPCPATGQYKYVRMRITGTNHRGDYALALTSFELFGVLHRSM
jgi:hypothetical protein